ncbi:hypothetical protein Pla123a_45250 [Posidoniimonas polymericola]|uniref:Uncharacterized protein n=1 Tax=Posidoniimonas polymericola TaxID=2528002 RepID=A0A5C5XUB8_9BACT|nr:hypothetical protein [Posidoniimonas polymericola]TWT66827.1 hypothetical protein Pla123a_45250 [Posidoniimonas polymericola]
MTSSLKFAVLLAVIAVGLFAYRSTAGDKSEALSATTAACDCGDDCKCDPCKCGEGETASCCQDGVCAKEGCCASDGCECCTGGTCDCDACECEDGQCDGACAGSCCTKDEAACSGSCCSKEAA